MISTSQKLSALFRQNDERIAKSVKILVELKTKNLHIVVATALSLVLLCSCAYKRYYRDGVKYEASSMYNLAFDRYMASLDKKETADARVALNRVATHYVSQLQEGIETDYNTQNDDALVSKYQKLASVVAQAERHDVVVTVSERTQGEYTEAKNRYIIEHYERGQQQLEEENFAEAYKEFDAVSAVNSDYEDVQRLKLLCQCESLYRDAMTSMKAEKYRTAYNKFENLLNLDANYKDALQQQKNALDKAILTIAFANFSIGNSSYRRVADNIQSNTKTKITAVNNKFIKLVEVDQTQKLLQEQKLALANGLDLKTNIIPVRAHLSCNISNLSHTYSTLKKTEKKGYIRETKKDGSYVYHKVTYYEYKRTLKSAIAMNYSLISVETGFTLISDALSYSYNDEVHYAIYDGSYKGTLLPGYWESTKYSSDKDEIKSDYSSTSALNSLLKARQELKSTTEIEDSFVNSITTAMCNKLLNYNPEK